MRIRRTAAAVALAAAGTVTSVTTGVVAFAHSSAPSAGAVSTLKKKPSVAPSKEKKVKVAFSASGTVTAADAAKGTITMTVKGGAKDVRGRTVTISVPSSARIVLNGRKVQVGALAAGHKITVTGTRIDSVYTAAKIQASGKAVKPAPTKPAPSPSATPTASPSAPSASPSAPSASPSAPSASPSAPDEDPTDSPEDEPTEAPEPTESPE
ncbi:hypothetical protein [Actinoplanes sp. GCM10030250]|uniref:hypothetical protein n=1 Tax=Actinoplanes sp. GCM10030250 TaxID=3273376 RepID=UPI00362125EA